MMDEATKRGRFLGRVEIRYYGRSDDAGRGTPALPPGIGDAEVLWESEDPGATEARLKRWALDELTGEVKRIFGPSAEALPRDHPATFPWPTVFRPGDVVRRRDGRTIAVVVGVVNYSPEETPRYELHVDVAVDGVRVGGECWDPWVAVPSNDADSIAEARGLRLTEPTAGSE